MLRLRGSESRRHPNPRHLHPVRGGVRLTEAGREALAEARPCLWNATTHPGLWDTTCERVFIGAYYLSPESGNVPVCPGCGRRIVFKQP